MSGHKIYFAMVCLFFVVMNVLLWRSEFGRHDLSIPIPVESVTRRLLGAVDDSNLEIHHRGKKIGYCRWAPGTLEAASSPASPTSAQPEGMVQHVAGYSIDLSGNAILDPPHRLRFNYSIQVETNFLWSQMMLRLQWHHFTFEVRSTAADETLNVTVTQDQETRTQTYTFEQWRNPEALLRSLGGPVIGNLVGAMGLTTGELLAGSPTLGLEWKAGTDRRTIGRTSIPVYRLETSLLQHYPIAVYILQSGEILRVELPDDLVLINDHLLNL